jgi:RNA polymerase sigma factor (TIGR02999 family)
VENGRADDGVTELLARVSSGEPGAVARLMPLVYDELRLLARHHRRRWRDADAPGTQSLVHEVYLRLVDVGRSTGGSRAAFFALASRAMRSILIDNARHAQRQKREGSRDRVPLADDMLVSGARTEEMLALDDALTRLAAADATLAAIVECRFFGGLTIDETAEALAISAATVKRGWTMARAWLYRELAARAPGALDDGRGA